MRNFFLLLLMTSGVFSLGRSQSPKQPFVITISPESQTVRSGSEAEITVHLKNTSDRKLDLSANISDLTGVDPNYTYEVRDSSGNLVPQRTYKHPELATGHAVFRTVQPGESVTDSEPIGRLLDVSKPGKYVIQVSRRVSKDEKDGEVKSNKITLAVSQ